MLVNSPVFRRAVTCCRSSFTGGVARWNAERCAVGRAGQEETINTGTTVVTATALKSIRPGGDAAPGLWR